MSEEWDLARIKRDYINAQAEENMALEYKAAGALEKSDRKKTEITKDVSAMANADGGILIYGIKEFKETDKRHLPEGMDAIDRGEFPKEWLEQVINNIRPRIDGLKIEPVDLEDGSNGVLYVVKIPKGSTAHQAKDYRYYRRFNFECVPMEDYEVRDVMNRATTPNVEVEFSCQCLNAETYRLRITVSNKGIQVVDHYKLKFAFPNFNLPFQTPWVGLMHDSEPIGRVDIAIRDESAVGIWENGEVYQVVVRSRDVLFPQDTVALDEYLNLDYWVDPKKPTFLGAIGLTEDWILYADNMNPKSGQIRLSDLIQPP